MPEGTVIYFDPALDRDPHQDREFDANQIDCILDLTPAQRLAQNDGWRALLEAAGEARSRQNGPNPAIPQASE